MRFIISSTRHGYGEKYGCFWQSGGYCRLDSDYGSHIENAEWEIDYEELPVDIRCYAEEIDEVFNDNVPMGCCGGCI